MSSAARRGRLKVFFGAAPGVGKTYAMLLEAHDLQEQGKDVVIGLVESHKRAATAALTAGLPTVPLKVVRYRTGRIREVNVEAIIARKPDIVLIDELAHTITHSDQPQSAEGNEGALHAARHTKRWQDIEQILDAGIDVISTLNIQHLESLNDVVFDITGKRQRETVPDWVVREADDVELVDLGPDALQVRLRDGLIYRPEQVDAALANYFSIGNLIALRELALLWMADKVDEGLEKYRADENIDKTLPARERLVVAVEGADFSPVLIRRAARMAGRMKGRELHAVYVAADTGLTGISQSRLTELRRLTESLGGTWHTVTGGDVPQAIIGFATMINATQIVVGASRSLWRERLFGPGVSSRVIAGAGSIDVCIVSQRDQARRSVRWRGRSAMTWQRRVLACVVGGVWSLLTTVVVGLWGFGASEFSLAPVGYFAGVVFAALIGGLWPALATAVLSVALTNWFFARPFYSLQISHPATIVAFALFVVVAAAVAMLVDQAATRAEDARRAKRQALLLSELAGTVIREGLNVDALLTQISHTFGQTSVALARWVPAAGTGDEGAGGSWQPDEYVGDPIASVAEATSVLPIGGGYALWLRGRALTLGEGQILDAYAGRILRMLNERELEAVTLRARRLQAANSVRTALLNAVSHDLRTPLASIKASVSSLRMTDVELPPELHDELLETIETSADNLERIISHLVEMGRIQTEELDVTTAPVDLGDVVGSALRHLPPSAKPARLAVKLPPDLPRVQAEAGLLERIITNLVDNVAKYGGDRCVIDAAANRECVTLRVVDYGPGLADAQKRDMYTPFRRFNDRETIRGLGLGLAVARGLAEASGASLDAHDTPGGGLTMVVTLPLAQPVPTMEGAANDDRAHR